MKIEYEILWIDDMKSWIDSVRDDVIEYLEEKGFIAKITEIIPPVSALLAASTA